MKTIFEVLREDHDVQRSLIDKLLTTQGATTRRKELFAALKKQLDEHAKYEERFFYKPLMSEDRTQQLSRHGVAEHKELDDIMEDLETSDMSSPGWLTRLKTLEDKLIHHLAEEEREFFQQAGHVLSTKQKHKLASEYLSEMSA